MIGIIYERKVSSGKKYRMFIYIKKTKNNERISI